MAKSRGSSTQTTAPDAQTAQYGQQVWNAANGAANSGGTPVNQNTLDAAKNFGGFAAAGNMGLGAMSGNPEMMKQFMDPYQQNVINSMRDQYGVQRAGVTNDVNAQATAAGAFGGSRHGVAEGVAQAGLGRDQNQQMASLMDTGFNNAMGRAGQAANLGFGASGAQAQIGDYMHGVDVQNDPNMRMMQYLQSAYGMMPHGSSTTTTQTPGHNGITGALGGAATGAKIGSMFGPGIGTGVGAGIGGLLGLFG